MQSSFWVFAQPKKEISSKQHLLESTPPVPVSWEIHEVSEGQL